MKINDVYYNEHADRVTVVEIDPDLFGDFVTVESELGNRMHITKEELNNYWVKK